jgi:hypothetical protein
MDAVLEDEYRAAEIRLLVSFIARAVSLRDRFGPKTH